VRDDNVAITMTSGDGDLVNIVMTSRPELLRDHLSAVGDVSAAIDDFRRMTLRKRLRLLRRRYERRRGENMLWLDECFKSGRRNDG
jgi:hypothetical protein